MFKEEYIKAISAYTSIQIAEELWLEIEEKYSDVGRHYHTMTHLNNLYLELKPFQPAFENWSTIIFAIAYHDVIYTVLRSDNEEASARHAKKQLTRIGFDEHEIEKCVKMIQATKKHTPCDEKTDLFTDADLSILGADTEVYEHYVQQVRKEYAIYPDLIYKPGRKKVLTHFLSMSKIFKTDSFFNKYEGAARLNLENELKKL